MDKITIITKLKLSNFWLSGEIDYLQTGKR